MDRFKSYYVWPVVMINNNIALLLFIKNEHTTLAFIVLSKRQMRNMNLYLEPLIDEFKKLWEGVPSYDVSRPILTWIFSTLYGICAYTMHDYS